MSGISIYLERKIRRRPLLGRNRAPPQGNGLMDADRIREVCEILDVSQVGLGRLLGYTGRTVRRWFADQLEIPLVVAMALEMMVATKMTPARAYFLATGEKVTRDHFRDQSLAAIARRARDDE